MSHSPIIGSPDWSAMHSPDLYLQDATFGALKRLALQHGDRFGLVVDHCWKVAVKSDYLINCLLWWLDCRILQGSGKPVCFPVIGGVPRIAFSEKGSDIKFLLNYKERSRYDRKICRYTKYTVTYIGSLEEFVVAAGKYLTSLPRARKSSRLCAGG